MLFFYFYEFDQYKWEYSSQGCCFFKESELVDVVLYVMILCNIWKQCICNNYIVMFISVF